MVLLLVTAMAILEVQAVALVAVMAAAPGKGAAVGLVIRNNLSKVKNMQQQKHERQAENHGISKLSVSCGRAE